MASYQKRGKTWRVTVRRKGTTETKTFAKKDQAIIWAARIETDIAERRHVKIPDIPFSKLLERYRDNVSTVKRGERSEKLRIGVMLRDKLASVSVRKLSAPHAADWRDRRLKIVSSGTVRREFNLISHVCNIAVNEWKWLKENPFAFVRRPPSPANRDRIYTVDQIERLTLALGEDTGTIAGRVGVAFRFAIETAMRAGEICALNRNHINGKVATLLSTKNGTNREVPLSPEAIRLIRLLPENSESLFNLNVRQIDTQFRVAKKKTAIQGMNFHDTRHTAVTRLAKLFPVLALARIVGHRNINMLLIYYNESAENMAALLE